MKRFFCVAILTISLVFCGCGDDEPAPDITQSDLDKRLDALEDELNTLRADIAKGNVGIVEGSVPVDIRDSTEVIQDKTGGLPPSGEPTGEPVDDPFGGVAVVGAGRIVLNLHTKDGVGNGIYVMDANGGGRRQWWWRTERWSGVQRYHRMASRLRIGEAVRVAICTFIFVTSKADAISD